MNNYIKCLRTMLLCFIVILFICVVVGVIKYSTAHSLKQEKDIKLSTIDNEKFTMEKYYTDSKPLLIIYFHPECYFEGGNLAASKIRNLECPSYEICLIDYGCGKFNRKIHIMEQYP